jgi:hypothetical protein
MNAKLIYRYFKAGNPGSLGCLLIVFGTFLTLIGGLPLLLGLGVTGATALFLPVGAFLLIVGSNLTRSGRGLKHVGLHLDNLFEELEKSALEAAFSKLGVDRNQVTAVEPLVISGYVFKGLPAGTVAKEDPQTRKWRSPLGEVAVILFSENMLYSYKRKFSFLDTSYKAEETDEYFYRDVVSISTKAEEESLKIRGRNESVSYESITLTTSGGTSVKCALYDTDSVNRSLAAARNLIREKKS